VLSSRQPSDVGGFNHLTKLSSLLFRTWNLMADTTLKGSGFDMGPQILKTKKKSSFLICKHPSAQILMYFRTLENSSNLEIRNPSLVQFWSWIRISPVPIFEFLKHLKIFYHVFIFYIFVSEWNIEMQNERYTMYEHLFREPLQPPISQKADPKRLKASVEDNTNQ
ncbi:hypothetical protein RhiirC2_719378, partial [Rhizophagus irregularis]